MTKMHLMNRFENKMDKICVLDSKANVPESMRDVIDLLNIANDAYYLYDDPIMSDKRYDDLVEWLEIAEEKTGIIFSSSPLHSVPGKILEGLKKVKHTKPMLSANKTKDMDEIGRFIADKKVVQSWKLDGLTIVVRYEKGKYKRAITRGNGEIGEDVTEAIRHCKNIPLMLNENVDLELRGECVISWSNFNAINEQLDNAYSHPRNLAAGSVRCLDTNIAKDRYLEYKVFELVNVNGKHMNVVDSFKYLYKLGFDVVEYAVVDNATYMDVDKQFNPEKYDYPVDGCIYKYDSYEYGESLGATSHHPLNMIARKWTDELHETTLKDIVWQTSKSGLVNPVAVFDPVDLDGAVTTRATLHNLSIIRELELGIGDTIQVYRANSVIPKVHDNLTRSGDYPIPTHCSCCGCALTVRNDNGRKTLHCTNGTCMEKVVAKVAHFCSRDAMNIDGMSESTIEKLIEHKLLPVTGDSCIETFFALYELYNVRDKMVSIEGFGEKSIDKLLQSIEKSKETTLDRFLYALSIPNIGKTASKEISKAFDYSWDSFYSNCIEKEFDFTVINGIGSVLSDSINKYLESHKNAFSKLPSFQVICEPKTTTKSMVLSGANIVVTGKLNIFKNRNELIERVENAGGKVSGTVSKNTSYLVNNDIDSSSSKNKKAKELGVKIITEKELLDML